MGSKKTQEQKAIQSQHAHMTHSAKDLVHDETSRQIHKDKLLLRHWPRPIGGQMLKQVQHDRFSKPINTHSSVIACLTRDLPLWKCVKAQAAFTLAETLIALAVIGIVAALTIPGIVKNYNQTAWTHAKTVFSRKLDVALKEMNTEGTLTGYRTTEAFVNELKKNIKITRVCTGNKITNCFADKVVWDEGEDPIEITTSSVKFAESKENQFDWAEPVGIQFVNGINAIIGYNKNCYSDPYNNQYSPSSTCIGIMYDVSGFKKPNANGKDIASNGNVALSGCAFSFSIDVDGKKESVCFTKVLEPNTGYSPLPITKADGSKIYCSTVKGDLGISDCYYGEPDGYTRAFDYWAGAAYACGGVKKMATMEQLAYLATYLYGYNGVMDAYTDYSGLTRKDELLGPFHNIDVYSYFGVWSGQENRSYLACSRDFNSNSTIYSNCSNGRDDTTRFAVCVK